MAIVEIMKKEYKEGHLGVIDYTMTFLKVPVYKVKFTTTNRDIVGKLGELESKTLHICGFTTNQKK